MVAFVDAHRDGLRGRVDLPPLPIAPSTYWRFKAAADRSARPSARARRDEALKAEIDRVWHQQEAVYGADKVWRQLRLEGLAGPLHGRTADEGLRSAGRRCAAITIRPDSVAVVPDLVDRRVHREPAFVLDALEQAIHQRGADGSANLVHHSDRGVQYLVRSSPALGPESSASPQQR